MMEQMRILRYAFRGTALLGTGNVEMGNDVLMRKHYALGGPSAVMDQMKILKCVANGTASLDQNYQSRTGTGNAIMDSSAYLRRMCVT